MGWHPTRQLLRRSRDELVQPLCLRRGRRLDVPEHRRHRCGSGGAGIPPVANRATTRSRSDECARVAGNGLRDAVVRVEAQSAATRARRHRSAEHVRGNHLVGRPSRPGARRGCAPQRTRGSAHRPPTRQGRGRGSRLGALQLRGHSMTQPRWSIAPYFIVDDVVATANYYRDKLGFGYERFWNEPPSFCMVRRNGVIIMLAQLEQPGLKRPNHLVDPEGGAWDAYVWVDDADALNAEFKSKDVKIARDICDQPYGCRDFDIEDCNGYRLCFGHDLEG